MSTLEQFNAKLASIHDRATAVTSSYGRQREEIRSESGRTDEWKHTETATARDRCQAKLRELRDKEQQLIDQTVGELESSMFGLAAWASKDDTMSFRDATDRAGRIDVKDETGGLRAMRQAILANDSTMQKALFVRAHECDWADVLALYFKERPHVEREYRTLAEVQRVERDDVTRHYRYQVTA